MELGKPPVVEAWIEFRFRVAGEASPWDETHAELFMKQAYPDSFKIKDYIGHWDLTLQQEAGRPSLTGNRLLLERVRACDETGSRFVQAGRDILIYNMLRLDLAWPQYTELRRAALEAYEKYLSFAKPEGLASIGLHYRDVVIVPLKDGEAMNLDDYLLVRPTAPEVLGNLGGVRMSLTFPAASEAGVLRLGVHDEVVPPETGGAVSARFRFDWHLATEWSKSSEIQAVEAWLDSAHEDILRMFKGCFTDRCWNLFEPEEV
jgi:uncharacterized protein (TIGR04255 family)